MEAHHGTSLDGPQYPPEVWDGQLGLGVALGDTMPDKTFLHVPWYPLESEEWDGEIGETACGDLDCAFVGRPLTMKLTIEKYCYFGCRTKLC